MNQFKKAKVIMLPTEKESDIWSHRGRKLYYQQANFNDVEDEIRYNLYIISNDKIELGDYYYRPGINEIFRGSGFIETDKKVISSTEKLNDLPQPYEEFIEKYIETYNSGEVITDILVEYEGEKSGCLNYKGNGGTQCDMPCDNAGWCPDNRDKLNLKINQDNTINIGLLKDSWTREEVEEIARKAFQAGVDKGISLEIYKTELDNNPKADENFDKILTENKWIEKNL